MAEYDLVVRGGEVATGFGTARCDIGIRGGRIVALAERIEGGAATLDAGGLLVLPGGVDSHCHIEEPSRGGYVSTAGDPAGHGERGELRQCQHLRLRRGTTSVVCFVPQWKHEGILPRLADYEQRAAKGWWTTASTRSSPTRRRRAGARGAADRRQGHPQPEGLPDLRAAAPDDEEYIKVLVTARKNGCLVTVHCENYAAIKWRTEALLAAGMTSPKYHAWSRPSIVEREATHRAIALAELVDQPIQVFHVELRRGGGGDRPGPASRPEGLGRDLPAIPALTGGDMDRPGFEGAAFMCSPSPAPPRNRDGSGR